MAAENVGGLVGWHFEGTSFEGAVNAVYATGLVDGFSKYATPGGLMSYAEGIFSDSYWDIGTTGQSSSKGGVGKTTSELQTPTGYRGIYTGWNLDFDGGNSGGDSWDFGSSSQYPALKADLNGDGVATVGEFGGRLGHQIPRPGVAVSKTAVTVGENGGTEDYTVVLRIAPRANVTVTPASRDEGVATVSERLRFTPGNWSTAQVVTVTGVNDNINNADDRRTTAITYTVASTDSGYNGIAVPRLAVVVANDDTAALALSVNPTTLAEDGNAAEVTVRATLSGVMPDYDLELPLVLGGTARAGADYKVSAELPAITVPKGDSSATARLTLTPVDDTIGEGNETIIIGVAHARFGTAAPAQVALTDNDTAAAGLALSVSPKTLAEGASATEVTVTATLSSVNNSGLEVVLPLDFAGSAARNVDYAVSGPATIRIADGTGKGATRLTLTPTDDAIDEGLGEAIELRTAHNNKQVAATLLLTDDDHGAPALSIEMAVRYSGTDPIPVRFVFPEPVTDFAAGGGVTVTGGTLGGLSTQDGGRTYASAVTPDYSLPDAVTVEVGANAVTDRSGNTGPAAPVAATANRRGLAVAPQSMVVAEGRTASYRVALTSEPAGQVRVMVASGALAVAAVTPTSLTFAPDNWGTAQVVMVSGVADADTRPEQKRTASVTHTAAGADYAGIAGPAVTVTVAGKIDYDADNDGLIEITRLEQLNAMRWDLNGDGDADSADNDSTYEAAFPAPFADAGAGNGALGCSDSSGSAAPCTGYELKADLDFDDDASYTNVPVNKASWTGRTGWAPVGDESNQFAAAFDGNGHSIANLLINRPRANNVGLFGWVGPSARLRGVGLVDANVTGNDYVGALAGVNQGAIKSCYATGAVAGDESVSAGWSGRTETGTARAPSAAALPPSPCRLMMKTSAGLWARAPKRSLRPPTRRGWSVATATWVGWLALAGIIKAPSAPSTPPAPWRASQGPAAWWATSLATTPSPTATGTSGALAGPTAKTAWARPPPSCRRPSTTPASTPAGTWTWTTTAPPTTPGTSACLRSTRR